MHGHTLGQCIHFPRYLWAGDQYRLLGKMVTGTTGGMRQVMIGGVFDFGSLPNCMATHAQLLLQQQTPQGLNLEEFVFL